MFMPELFDFGLPNEMKREHDYNGVSMRTDIKKDKNGMTFTISLPEFDKENVKVMLKDGYLRIKAEQPEKEESANDGKYMRRERWYGSCSRSFFVGKEVKQEDVDAKFENGNLIVTIPDKTAEKESLIEIH